MRGVRGEGAVQNLKYPNDWTTGHFLPNRHLFLRLSSYLSIPTSVRFLFRFHNIRKGRPGSSMHSAVVRKGTTVRDMVPLVKDLRFTSKPRIMQRPRRCVSLRRVRGDYNNSLSSVSRILAID